MSMRVEILATFFNYGSVMEAQVEIIPKLEKTSFYLEILAAPGKVIPNINDIKNILNENLEPYLGINIRSMQYANGENCKN
jgi:hypothetical protein